MHAVWVASLVWHWKPFYYYQHNKDTALFMADGYLNLLNLSLSASNMCLRLRFRWWAVNHSCSFWKLGSCVRPMMSVCGGSCRGWWFCSASLAGVAGRGPGYAFWRATFLTPAGRPRPHATLSYRTLHTARPLGEGQHRAGSVQSTDVFKHSLVVIGSYVWSK